MHYIAKGRAWRAMHSLWLAWVLTLGMLNWIAFLYIGLRGRRPRWLFWGVIYAIPVILLISESFSDVWTGLALLTVAIVSPVHALVVRREYLARLEDAQRDVAHRRHERSRYSGAGLAGGSLVGGSMALPAEEASWKDGPEPQLRSEDPAPSEPQGFWGAFFGGGDSNPGDGGGHHFGGDGGGHSGGDGGGGGGGGGD